MTRPDDIIYSGERMELILSEFGSGGPSPNLDFVDAYHNASIDVSNWLTGLNIFSRP